MAVTQTLEYYTDGSAKGTVGGYAFTTHVDGKTYDYSQGETYRPTNNRMEEMGILLAIQHATAIGHGRDLAIITDSEHTKRSLTPAGSDVWDPAHAAYRRKKNIDIWTPLIAAGDSYPGNIRIIHTRAHGRGAPSRYDAGNARADMLADLGTTRTDPFLTIT